MSVLSRLYQRPAPAFERLGIRLLVGAYVGFLALTTLVLFTHPEWLPFLLGLLLGGMGAFVLLRYPTVNFITVIVGFYLISGYSPEITPSELLYTFYALGYLVGWFFLRWVVYTQPIVRNLDDALLMGLLIYASLSIIHNRILQGEFTYFLNEWAAFVLLGFYFPVKEVVSRWEKGPQYVVVALLALTTFMSLRNIYVLVQDFMSIQELWQLLLLRETPNKQYFLFGSTLSLLFVLYAKTKRNRFIWFMLFTINLLALIGTQTRAMWLVFAFGTGLILLLLPHQQRMLLIWLILSGVLFALSLAWFILGDTFLIILAGFIDRILSISSAFTQDLSLLNRYYEARQVLEYIKENPLAGYGLGVPYRFYDLVHRVTLHNTWIHNGFVGVWYKFGLLGFIAIFTFWFLQIWRAYAAMQHASDTFMYIVSVSVFITLAVLFPTTFSHNPFHNADSLFLFALLTGTASGLYERMK